MSDWQNQQTRRTRRPRRLEEVTSSEIGFPIIWVVVGVLSGLIIIGLVGLGVVNIVRKQSITPTPSAIPGLAPTQSIVASTPVQQAATPTIPPVVTLEPTLTPIPTQTPTPAPPTALEVGGFAKIVGTEGAGVSVRAGPGTNNARLSVANDDNIILILDGPRADENQQEFVWWFVRAEDGIEGWIVQDFMEPSLPPTPSQ